ncbi:hypothetical protein FE257_011804 [Aspergillus nanangensis]|uniref:Uncharacterized protein n=1 Tax=Aspergillus nanangensis TaxID=2582783 RepID=A0AAD4CX73_ASPNN|nr:hypothetical protein FE257_011804 [Aspergillus nanangensis]
MTPYASYVPETGNSLSEFQKAYAAGEKRDREDSGSAAPEQHRKPAKREKRHIRGLDQAGPLDLKNMLNNVKEVDLSLAQLFDSPTTRHPLSHRWQHGMESQFRHPYQNWKRLLRFYADPNDGKIPRIDDDREEAHRAFVLFYDLSATLLRRKCRWHDDYHDENYDDRSDEEIQGHRMEDLETGDLHPPSDINLNLPAARIPNYAYAACHGSLQAHSVEINGIQKVVLVYSALDNGAHDAYAEWLKRWRHRHQGEAFSCARESSSRIVDEASTLPHSLDEGVS